MILNQPFTLRARWRSLHFARRGLGDMLLTQHNARVHLVATWLVLLAGLLTGISVSDWALLVMAMVAVWMAEAFNTALEYLCDAVTEQYHPLIGRCKDIAAAAVLISALGAVMIGLLVFLPYWLPEEALGR